MKAKLLSCFNVRREVVDERNFRWVQLMLPHKETEELQVGLDKANSAGDEDARKPVQEGEEIANDAEFIGAPV